MLEIIQGLDPKLQGLILLSILGVLVYSIRHGLKINSKFLDLSFSPGTPKIEPKDNTKTVREKARVSHHANCPYKYEALDFIRTISENERKITLIKEKTTVKKEMELAEESLKKLTSLFSTTYLKLLKDLGHEDPVSAYSYQSYRKTLELLECRMKEKIRFFVHENHFAERTEQNFVEFIATRTDTLSNFVTEVLNDIYLYREDITRAQLYDANSANIDEILKIMKEFFYGCRDISKGAESKIRTLEAMNAYVWNKFKEEPSTTE